MEFKERTKNVSSRRLESKAIIEGGITTGVHEMIFNELGLLEERWLDEKGEELERANYERDSSNRIVEESWIKKGVLEGKYTHEYDARGKFIGKNGKMYKIYYPAARLGLNVNP